MHNDPTLSGIMFRDIDAGVRGTQGILLNPQYTYFKKTRRQINVFLKKYLLFPQFDAKRLYLIKPS